MAEIPTLDVTVTVAPSSRKHSHYFKSTRHFTEADVYRVTRMFGVTDMAICQAIKKLLLPGGRGGGKALDRDVQEAIDSLLRWQEMEAEDAAGEGVGK